MKVIARANGNVIDLPDDHPLIGVLYDPVDESTKQKPTPGETMPPKITKPASTKVAPLTTKDIPQPPVKPAATKKGK